MRTVIALLFCLALAVMLKVQGIITLLWLPLGFALALFVTAQVALLLILGLPRAIRLVSRGECLGRNPPFHYRPNSLQQRDLTVRGVPVPIL